MKKKFWLILLAMGALGLSGCQSKVNSEPAKAYDLAISYGNQITTFKTDNNQLEKVETRQLFDKNIGIWQERLQSVKGNLYGKTHESPNSFKKYLFDVEPKTLKGKLTEVGGNDIYGSASDEEYIYTTAVFLGHTDFYKYDTDLHQVTKKSIKEDGLMNLTNDMIFVGDTLYVLVGAVDNETATNANYLWVMNKQLEVQEKIDLNYTEGGYFRMVEADGKLYMTAAKEGIREDGEPDGGQHILVYDLASGETSRIETKLEYPKFIYYDESRHQLLVLHDPLYVADYTWTIIDLETLSQTQFTFPEIASGMLEVFFTQTDSDYYFLFNEQLVKYSVDTQEKTIYDLSKFGIDYADAIIFSE
ncbi:lipoprotein [Streptococcus gallolyticus]|uniref:Lipoprotein n=1 Tax=Streptococcus gallolyticus TaxID=315405 RepID=A0AA94S9K7_9STRE|nr:hypothetical protein [Streptococcus gallolyticus]AQP41129.1 hypothetical protein BTR42_00620 [Streptococcus gallolyticus subsp. gallolyticus DSM 16831]SQG78408.1 lipoprotein [Streptococcus gallolyticus]